MSDLLPISLLIPTMHRPNTLRKTLLSISSGDALPAQIVVVDQSFDKENRERNQETLEELPETVEKVFIHQEYPSLTIARNNAMQSANQEVLVFADDDIDVYPDTFKNIARIMTDSRIAMIAGIDDNSQQAQTNIGYWLGTKSYRNKKIGHVTSSMLGRYPDLIEKVTATQWAMGYFFVIRKSLCEKYDLTWDETLTSYAYAEDLDFSFTYYKKASQLGLLCILSPEVRVKHMISKEYRIPSYRSTWMYVVHRRYLSYKHGCGWGSRAAMNWCDLWRLIERIIKHQNPGDMLKAYLYYAKNKAKIKRGFL